MLFLRSSKMKTCGHKTEKEAFVRDNVDYMPGSISRITKRKRYWLYVGLMKCHETGVDRNGHRSKMKVIKEHWQMIVKALRRCEVQLQRPEKERPIDHGLYNSDFQSKLSSISSAQFQTVCEHISNRCLIYLSKTRLTNYVIFKRSFKMSVRNCLGKFSTSLLSLRQFYLSSRRKLRNAINVIIMYHKNEWVRDFLILFYKNIIYSFRVLMLSDNYPTLILENN